MPPTREQLLIQLRHAEKLAVSNVFKRWMHQPWQYLIGMTIAKGLFPVFHYTLKAEARTFFGSKMQVQLPAGLDIFLTHTKSHDSEIRLARWMIRHLNAGHVFIDGGAHFGFYSLLANVLGCRVFSFEPTPATFALLSENRPGHTFEIFQAGLSDTTAETVFYTFGGSYSEYNTLDAKQYLQQEWLRRTDCQEEQIQVVRLDDFCQERNITPDYIKLDVEGSEDRVLTGARNLLDSQQPVVIMEYHPGQEDSPHLKAAGMLADLGYVSYFINSQGQHERCGDIALYFQRKGLDSDNLIFLKNELTAVC